MSRKYDSMFYEFVPIETNGEWLHSPEAYFKGDQDIPEADFHIGFQIIKAPVLFEDAPHFHREEEYLVFLGIRYPDVFDFDAEINFYMGPDVKNMELITVTKPTVIRIPKGMWHCPLDFKRVGKPLLFQATLMHGKAGAVKLGKNEKGEDMYYYQGDELLI